MPNSQKPTSRKTRIKTAASLRVGILMNTQKPTSRKTRIKTMATFDKKTTGAMLRNQHPEKQGLRQIATPLLSSPLNTQKPTSRKTRIKTTL